MIDYTVQSSYGNHKLKVHMDINPKDLFIHIKLCCIGCQWDTTISMALVDLTDQGDPLVQKIKNDLLDSFRKMVPESCEEAKNLSKIMKIMTA